MNLYRKTNKLIKKIKPELYYFLKDNYEVLSGQRDKLIPPERMNFVGDGDFKKIGDDYLKYFIEIGGLKPADKVLDVGCGIGRMAVPLTKYLSNKEGSYEGFDIVKSGIDWCKNKITPRYPNFNFQLADIYNKHYNSDGKFKSSDYKFPFQDGSFDFIFLTSVFTHMLSEDIENYLKEISRVLKPGGKCFITYFLLNDDSLNNMNIKSGRFSFKYKSGESYIDNQEVPEAAIAHNEVFIKNLHLKNKLKIKEPIQYGSWCGRDIFLSFQDIIISEKE